MRASARSCSRGADEVARRPDASCNGLPIATSLWNPSPTPFDGEERVQAGPGAAFAGVLALMAATSAAARLPADKVPVELQRAPGLGHSVAATAEDLRPYAAGTSAPPIEALTAPEALSTPGPVGQQPPEGGTGNDDAGGQLIGAVLRGLGKAGRHVDDQEKLYALLVALGAGIVGLVVFFRARRDPAARIRAPTPPSAEDAQRTGSSPPEERGAPCPGAEERIATSDPVPPEITIPPPPPDRVETESGREGSWVPSGQSQTIAGIEIGGMVYVGRELMAQRTNEPEPCLIDPSLPVATLLSDIEGKGLPYWPSYSRISLASRRAFLEWLSSGRSDPRYGIGYVFLYLYGIERRLFLERPGPEERSLLVAEVDRLRSVYRHHGSFSWHAWQLMEAAQLLDVEKLNPEPTFEATGWGPPLSVKLGIGRLLAAGQPLTGDWLLSLWMSHHETRLRTPARRAFPELRQLFALRLSQRYPDGLRLPAPKQALRYAYRAASGTFEREFRQELEGCPDIDSTAEPLWIAALVAEQCTDELDAFSRYLGRHPDGRGTIEAHALLPPDLAALVPNDRLASLEAWITVQIDEADGQVMLEDLLARLRGAPPTRVSRQTLTEAADILERMGVGLAPEPRFALRVPRLNDPVVLFHLPADEAPLSLESPDYAAALLSVTLGAFVASADGTVSEIEQHRLQSHVEKLHGLDSSLKARLRANIAWLASCPPQLGELRSALGQVPDEAKHALVQLSIAVAGADGTIQASEIRAIEKLYAELGLPADGIQTDIHALEPPAPSGPVAITAPAAVTPGVRDSAAGRQALSCLAPRDLSRSRSRCAHHERDRDRVARAPRSIRRGRCRARHADKRALVRAACVARGPRCSLHRIRRGAERATVLEL